VRPAGVQARPTTKWITIPIVIALARKSFMSWQLDALGFWPGRYITNRRRCLDDVRQCINGQSPRMDGRSSAHRRTIASASTRFASASTDVRQCSMDGRSSGVLLDSETCASSRKGVASFHAAEDRRRRVCRLDMRPRRTDSPAEVSSANRHGAGRQRRERPVSAPGRPALRANASGAAAHAARLDQISLCCY